MSKRNPIEITFHFNTIEEAIATLGSLVQKAAPVATVDDPAKPLVIEKPVVKPRKPRADAGKPRGPYKNVEASAQNAPQSGDPAAHEGLAASTPETAAPPETEQGVTRASESLAEQASGEAVSAVAAAPDESAVQAALERLFAAKGAQPALQLLAEFGVKRGRDLKPEQRADFIKKADEVASA